MDDDEYLPRNVGCGTYREGPKPKSEPVTGCNYHLVLWNCILIRLRSLQDPQLIDEVCRSQSGRGAFEVEPQELTPLESGNWKL
jgi:hypothetical protein